MLPSLGIRGGGVEAGVVRGVDSGERALFPPRLFEFIVLCRKLDLLGMASVAIDGSKFKAVNARDKNFTEAKMKRRLERIHESIARYLSQLETADRHGDAVPEATVTRLKSKIEKLKEEIVRLNAINAEMMRSEDKQISLTDPDARSIATSGNDTRIVGYNVQIAVGTSA